MRGTVLFCVIPVGMPPHGSPSRLLSSFLGAPLPMHGKDLLRSPGGRKERITPAHAGKSCAQRTLSPRPQDHPRVCGEKLDRTVLSVEAEGSPPPVRGKASRAGLLRQRKRITPACAGKSPVDLLIRNAPQDHPRLCGEKFIFVCRAEERAGSPPRVRRKVSKQDISIRGMGITPACAGKSICCLQFSDFTQDHPHVCGEKALTKTEKQQHMGSPPRVRGKVMRVSAGVYAVRITPACAGKR